jgi:cyclic-di-AMP phosphodiesterase PgpH
MSDSFLSKKNTKRVLFLLSLLSIVSVLTLIALAVPFAGAFFEAPLKTGDVAPQDIRAPYAQSFVSEIKTQEQIENVWSEVEPVYSPADPTIARRQLERLRAALTYITTVRTDVYANREQQLSDLVSLRDIRLKKETAEFLLDMGNSRWQTIQQEAILVLEQVMRTTVREDRLEETRSSVASYISFYLSDEHAAVVEELVTAFIVPNSHYNELQTEANRERAVEAAGPVVRTFAAGELIVQRGRVINSLDTEALGEFGLLESRLRWQDLASAGILAALSISFFTIYLKKNRWFDQDMRRLLVLVFLYLAFLFSARLIIPGHTILPYIFPLPAFGLVVTALFGPGPALVAALPVAVLASIGLPYALEISLFYALTTLIGILVLGRARRVTSFFWTGFAVAVTGVAVVGIYRLPQPAFDLSGMLTLAGVSVINGVASAGIALLLQFFLSQILGTTTALQLLELSRPDNPLLQILLRNAPGTYQHSLQVANLAEQAAERIGADALLTRVGALYHDIGKTDNSALYIENQIPGTINPHDEMDPITSAALIISHIPKGVELARKYRLPRRIQDFIREHHGSMVTRYQYSKAMDIHKNGGSSVNIANFTYPGPRPQSRETALLMLADASEATVRAVRPKDEAELRALIKNVVDSSVSTGALNDTDLTLSDLEAIIDSFSATLRGIYHPRIEYPKYETETPAEINTGLAPQGHEKSGVALDEAVENDLLAGYEVDETEEEDEEVKSSSHQWKPGEGYS